MGSSAPRVRLPLGTVAFRASLQRLSCFLPLEYEADWSLPVTGCLNSMTPNRRITTTSSTRNDVNQSATAIGPTISTPVSIPGCLAPRSASRRINVPSIQECSRADWIYIHKKRHAGATDAPINLQMVGMYRNILYWGIRPHCISLYGNIEALKVVKCHVWSAEDDTYVPIHGMGSVL